MGTEDLGGDDIPSGRLRRLAPVAAVTARTAGEAIVVGLRRKATGQSDPEFAARSAERYAEVLGRSKGVLMKAGQALSFSSLGPAVPPEFQLAYQQALARLRADAPPMAPSLARRIVEEELGSPVDRVFASFEPQPIAAASIGQVHRATLPGGRPVAVKVQYPGVADAIATDLRTTELVGTLVALLTGLSPRRGQLDTRGIAAEIEERITEELDYRREAADQALFAERYRDHPFIRVPGVVPELCSGRVLTQELAEGLGWDEALAAPAALRDRWGEGLFRFLYASQVRHCELHADPHPGNYLFGADGTLTVLDFGCVKRQPPEWIEAIHEILRQSLRGDVEATWRASVRAGFFAGDDPVTPQEVFAYWHDGNEMAWGPQPYTVTPQRAAAAIERHFSPTGPSGRALRHVRAPGGYATLARIEMGLLSVLGALRPTCDWRSIAEEMFEDAPPRTELGRLEQAHLAGREAVPGA